MFVYSVLIIGVAVAVSISVLFLIYRIQKKKRLYQALNLKLLLVRLPQKHKNSFAPGAVTEWKDEINFSSQLFGIMAGLKSPFGFEAAVHHVGEEIHFYAAVPRESIGFVSRQIEGLWKEASIEPIDDYNIFNPSGVSAGVYIKQKTSYILPIRTYTEANIDTFAPILSGLSKISEKGEGIAIQVMASPAQEIARELILKAIENLKKGGKLKDVLGSGKVIGFNDFKKAFNPEKKEEEKKEMTIIDEEAIKTLEFKISKPLLAVNLRIIASAPTKNQAEAILESVAGAFNQFGAPLRQELEIVRPWNIKKLIYQFSFREFDVNQAMIFNSEELSSFFHFPTITAEVPKIKWLKAKESFPPTNLPAEGTFIGESVFRGEKKPIYIAEDDRRRHIYVVGQTGTGKSTLIANMAIDDVRKGKGLCVIDPHGELTGKILGAVPRSRVDDVIVFDPSETSNPVGMNMLEYDLSKPEQKTFIVDEMQSIFMKLFPDSGDAMGPMFQQYMRNSLLLLMEDAANEPSTLMEVPRIFTDADYRERRLARIFNPVVIDFWKKEAIKVGGEASIANITPYITSKFNNFIANDYVRPIIGQVKSAFNFRKIMDEGKILFVNLSKGRIGDINANLLGMIIVGKILMAALSRADFPESERRDFNLYIDEFQNITTDSIASILSEARKYRLNLVAAHQFIAQLTEKVRDAVFGNIGSMVVFRVGPQDAEFLVKQFEPVFNENDLINIDNFNAYARIIVNGQTVKPFNIKIPPPEKGNANFGNELKELSFLKYGRDRIEVEKEILKRLRE